MLAVAAIWIGPFLKIGIQYLFLKLTAAVCGIFQADPVRGLMESFASAMGIVLAMTGTECLLLMVSTVCFMRGMT